MAKTCCVDADIYPPASGWAGVWRVALMKLDEGSR
jgi:hypothetical protein